jgi:dihydrofolate reductase
LEWNNSLALDGDIVSAISELKVQPGLDLQIIGSSNLIQTLHAAALIDEYNVWTYPVVLGRGKRLFEDGARPCALRLVASKVSRTGVVMSTYVPAGDIQLGAVGRIQTEPSAKELNRRAKMATGAW